MSAAAVRREQRLIQHVPKRNQHGKRSERERLEEQVVHSLTFLFATRPPVQHLKWLGDMVKDLNMKIMKRDGDLIAAAIDQWIENTDHLFGIWARDGVLLERVSELMLRHEKTDLAARKRKAGA